MAHSSASGILTFTYGHDEIFGRACLLSAYMTKNIKEGAQSAMDDYSMTDDENPMFLACLESSLPDIWEMVLKITSGVDGAYSIADGTAADTTEGDVTIKIQDNEAYNENTVDLVDASFKNCIIYGVLRDFYATNFHDALLKLANDRYSAEMGKLSGRLFQLKKKALA
jgi:hypothetical protein